MNDNVFGNMIFFFTFAQNFFNRLHVILYKDYEIKRRIRMEMRKHVSGWRKC